MNMNSTFIQRYSLLIYLILTPLISLAIALFLPVPIIVIDLDVPPHTRQPGYGHTLPFCD